MDHRRSAVSGSTAYERHRYMGIMAGIGTVIADDPKVDRKGGRLEKSNQDPSDSGLRIPLDGQIVKSAGKVPDNCGLCRFGKIQKKRKRLHEMGAETICCPDENNQVDHLKTDEISREEGIDSILLKAEAP